MGNSVELELMRLDDISSKPIERRDMGKAADPKAGGLRVDLSHDTPMRPSLVGVAREGSIRVEMRIALDGKT